MQDSNEVEVVSLADYPTPDRPIFEGWTPVELFGIIQRDEDFRWTFQPGNYDGGFAAFPDLESAQSVYNTLVRAYEDELRDDMDQEGDAEVFIGIFTREDYVPLVVTGQTVGDSSWIFERAGLKHYQSAHLSYERFLSEKLPLPLNIV